MSKDKRRLINLSYLNEISDGDNDLVLEIINIFITEVPTYIMMMKDYHQKEYWNELSKLAHKAKASSSIMGMKQLTNELKNLEILAKEKKDTRLYSSFILNIENQFNLAIEELKMISKTL